LACAEVAKKKIPKRVQKNFLGLPALWRHIPGGFPTMRLLIVEDYKPLLMALKRGLEEEGFTIDIALNAEEANDQALGENLDGILLNLTLPNKQNGLTLLQKWRQAGLKCPVLILTGRDRTEDKDQGLKLGAEDYVTKPFCFSDLVTRIRALTRRKNNPVKRSLQSLIW
jgi:two-component system, OmpR family, response regulator